MIKVVDGVITDFKLPKTGKLSNGEFVSGYNLLSEEILIKEGWLPLEENVPLYDLDTQYLEFDNYEVLQDKAIKHYNIKNFEDATKEISLNDIQEDSGMLALMVSMLMVEVDMLKAQIGGM